MLLLSSLPDWQQLTTPAGNKHEGVLFLWLVGMQPLLLRNPPFRLNPLDMLTLPSQEAFQTELNQAYILGHALVSCFVLPIYLSDNQLGVTLYDDLF